MATVSTYDNMLNEDKKIGLKKAAKKKPEKKFSPWTKMGDSNGSKNSR